MMTDVIMHKGDGDLCRGEILSFQQSSKSMFDAERQMWLVDQHWQALAEVSVLSQQLTGDEISGKLRVDYIYDSQQSLQISAMLVRMFACRVDPYIYFLIGEAEYQQAKNNGQLIRDSLDTEGFLHAAPKSQLVRLAGKHYRDVENLQVMIVAVDKLDCELKWEPATGGLYPHLFGPLSMDAVVDVVSFDELTNC